MLVAEGVVRAAIELFSDVFDVQARLVHAIVHSALDFICMKGRKSACHAVKLMGDLNRKILKTTKFESFSVVRFN